MVSIYFIHFKHIILFVKINNDLMFYMLDNLHLNYQIILGVCKWHWLLFVLLTNIVIVNSMDNA
jgi:hypothetical protein